MPTPKQPMLVIELLAVATVRVPVPKNFEKMDKTARVQYAATELSKLTTEELRSNIAGLEDGFPDQVSIETPPNDETKQIYVSEAYQAFMANPISPEELS